MPNKPDLSIDLLRSEAASFAQELRTLRVRELHGVTDGKAVGTFVESGFRQRLDSVYRFEPGNAAKGIDFPGLNVDLKVTSIRQPQSSCPFRNARQKVYGLGYSLLIMAYEKEDRTRPKGARLDIQHVIFVDAAATGDFQTTSGLRRLLDNSANRDDILAFFAERMLPLDEIGAESLADEVLRGPPQQGYLTISNALQWRLQYQRAIDIAGSVGGVLRLA